MSNQSTKNNDMNDDGMLNAETQRKLPQGKILQPKLRFKGFTDPWQQRKLGELAELSKGAGFSKRDLCEHGRGIILYGQMYTNYQLVIDCISTHVPMNSHGVESRRNDIIVPASGETPEDIAIASVVKLNGVLLGGDINVIRLHGNQTDATFIALLLSHGSLHKTLASRAQGKSIVHLHISDIANLHVLKPGITEQSRIAEFFRVLDDLIAAAKKKADLLKLKKRYYLQAIFSQQLRFKGFTEPWQQRKYSDYLIESNIPGHDGSEANKLTVKLWGKGVVEKETVTAGSNATKYYIRHTGQLMYGKLDFLHAAFGLVPPELDGYESTADSPAFDILPSADPNFILMTCLSEHTYLYQGNLADGSRKAKRVHVPTFLDMSLNVPNIEEQRRIVSFLHIIDKLIAAANHKAEVLIQQKNAYLQRLFV